MFELTKHGSKVPITDLPEFSATTRVGYTPISIGSFANAAYSPVTTPIEYKMDTTKVSPKNSSSSLSVDSVPTLGSIIHKVNNNNTSSISALPSYVPKGEVSAEGINNSNFYIDNGKLRTDNAFINAVMDLESYGGRLDAKNAKTGAFGPVQFLNSRLQDISKIVGNNFVYDASDVDSNATAIKAHFTDYINRLNKLGIPATPENLYYIHQQGFGGFLNLYKNMEANLYDTLGEDKFNKRILNNIPEDLRSGIDTTKFTGRDFMNLWANRFNSRYGRY